jgi:hypothetical protein
MTDPTRSLPGMDTLALEMRDAALELACMVREASRDDIAHRLASLDLKDEGRVYALVIMAVSMIDIDSRPVDELLAWMTWVDWDAPADGARRPGRPPAECGTWPAYLRHCRENTERRRAGLEPLPIHQVCLDAAALYREEHPDTPRAAPEAA